MEHGADDNVLAVTDVDHPGDLGEGTTLGTPGGGNDRLGTPGGG